MAIPRGLEPRFRLSESRVLPLDERTVVEDSGLEPLSPSCKDGSFPDSLIPRGTSRRSRTRTPFGVNEALCLRAREAGTERRNRTH